MFLFFPKPSKLQVLRAMSNLTLFFTISPMDVFTNKAIVNKTVIATKKKNQHQLIKMQYQN